MTLDEVTLVLNVLNVLNSCLTPAPLMRESRSLKAAFELMTKGGWTKDNLLVVDGGLQQWRYQGYPLRD